MKVNIGSEYVCNSQNFINKLKIDQSKKYPNLITWIENGRKYDKVLFSESGTRKSKEPNITKTKYFIERSTGDIYGAKSNIAPHFKWFYGNIENCEKWDWSGEFGGVPISDTSVKLVSEFKNYKHFQKVLTAPTK